MYDLLIRGGTVVDGLGRDPRRADAAITNSRIAAIGEIGTGAADRALRLTYLGLLDR